MKSYLPAKMVPTLVGFASIFFLVGPVSAQQKMDFKNSPFFKRLIGEWTAEGEERMMDGKVVKFKDEWKAQTPDDSRFIVEGSHEIAVKTTHYRWTFTRSDDHIFAVDQPDINRERYMRYEVQTDKDGYQMTLTRTRTNRLKIAVKERFKEGGQEILEIKETTTDVSGVTTHSSTSVSRKK